MFEKYIGQKVLARGTNAGVYYGTLVGVEDDTVEMENVRNIWSWSGATCLSDMAVHGVSRPDDCRFSVCVENMVILGVCQIIPCTEDAQQILEAVSPWTV